MFKKILCPVDFSDTAMNAAKKAIDFASEIKAEICFLHIIDLQALQSIGDLSGGFVSDLDMLIDEEKPILNNLKEECDKKGIKAQTLIVRGNPSDAVLHEAEKGGYDIIIMGTHGKKGVTRAVLGSVAEKIVRNSGIPVLLYHHTKK